MTQGLEALNKLKFSLCLSFLVCEIRTVDDMVSKGFFNFNISVFLFLEVLGKD